MHGNHGAGEAGADDCDIKNGGVFTHGLLRMRIGAKFMNKVSVDSTTPVGKR
jgi:hypothetical protein